MAAPCVQFRFHGELNRFIAPARRGRWSSYRSVGTASLKHAIEALGVPHTEVGVVHVDGTPCQLDARLSDGARLDVHPVAAHAGDDDSARLPRFIADAHLGALAEWLRLAGFDTLYDNFYQDDAIAELAMRESRIVLTRDRELLKRRAIARGAYVHAQRPELQLREVMARFALAQRAQPFRLCLRCNVPLRSLSVEEAGPRVPPRVRERCTRFTTCPACNRVFWEGSHWRRMRALMDDVTGRPGAVVNRADERVA
ncbi:Mut7-C RNAse domain-containing protein [Chitinasiproducens palmae]|nr:Mut7-C RNAse domain-containing protein [Chitinasiproducens palmae]